MRGDHTGEGEWGGYEVKQREATFRQTSDSSEIRATYEHVTRCSITSLDCGGGGSAA